VIADEHLYALAERLTAWLDDGTIADIAPVTEILALPVGQWRVLLEKWPADYRITATTVLVDRAYQLLHVSPKNAIPVARLAVHAANLIPGQSTENLATALELEGDAWRIHAQALLFVAEYDEALTSADQSASRYSTSIAVTLMANGSTIRDLTRDVHGLQSGMVLDGTRQVLEKAARLELVAGEIFFHQGRTDTGLSTIARACEILLYFFDNKDMYVKGRLVYGKLLIDAQQYSAAMSVFEETCVVANEIGYVEGQAHLVNNLGVCYYYRGDFDAAKQCAETAMQLFEELRKPIAAIRPRTLLVLLIMEQGKDNRTRYSAAAAELFKTRAAWLDAGMRLEAALVMLEIIRAFVLADRQDRINWAEMKRTFSDVGLANAAMDALQHLEVVYNSRPLTLDDVEDARQIIAHLDPTGVHIQKAG
jgi:tetratricopeptide (TPR) repeat protein